jgi:hypothetical protein
VLAYRDFFARPAAYEALREVLPEMMPAQQAKLETTQAIAYAAANHTKWFEDYINYTESRKAKPIVGSGLTLRSL